MPAAKRKSKAKATKDVARKEAKARRPRVTRKLYPGVKDVKSMTHQLRNGLISAYPGLRIEFKNDGLLFQYSSRRSVAVRLLRPPRKHDNVVRVDIFPPAAAGEFMRHKEWNGWDECVFKLSSQEGDSPQFMHKLAEASKLEKPLDQVHAVFRIEFSDSEVVSVAAMIVNYVMLADVRGG
jgi:hypothetical protein